LLLLVVLELVLVLLPLCGDGWGGE